MSEWKKCRLGDLTSLVCSGGTPRTTNSDYYEGGSIPWLNTKEVSFCRINSTEKCITESGLSSSSAKWVPANTVVVAMYGATAGQVAITRIPLTTNQACCNLVIDEGKANADFVYYSLVNSYRELSLLANGAAQQNLNAQVIKEFVVQLPDLPTQRCIAAVLGALDDKIENNRKICENLEAQAQALFKSWFVDFEPWGGKMPEGWKKGKLGDLGKIIGGATPSKARPEFYTETGIPWLTPKDLSLQGTKFVSRGELDISEAGFASSSTVKMPRGSVLFSSRAPIGYVAIARNEVCTNQGFKSVVPYEMVGTAYVYEFLKLNVKLIEDRASGSTFKEISSSGMREVPALVPDGEVLAEYESVMRPVFLQQENLDVQSRALAEMRDALLPQLMSGRLRVDATACQGEIDVGKVEI